MYHNKPITLRECHVLHNQTLSSSHIKIAAVCFCSPRTVKILFVNIKTAFSIVLPFLKPNCLGMKTLFTHKCWFGVLNITLCNIFDNVVNNEIDL